VGENSFNFEVHNEDVSGEKSLELHTSLHLGQSRYQCSVFKETSAARIFNKYIYTNTKVNPVECETYKRAFPDEYKLQTYDYTHTRKRTFKCDMWKSVFEERNPQASYSRTHRGKAF
jgi:hypothetical protein